MTKYLDHLEGLAEAAKDCGSFYGALKELHVDVEQRFVDEEAYAYIAALDPDTVKALVRVVRAADDAEDALGTMIGASADDYGNGDESNHVYWPVLQQIREALAALPVEAPHD